MGLVSFFNDMSTEMMYPILPIFLTSTLGASPAIVGFIYGIAKGVENIFRVIFGWLSDQFETRKPFVVFGYLLSSISKGLIGFSFQWQFVLLVYFFDRFGKSIRTSPRDVLLVGDSAPLARSRVFGFHRAADTFGAVAGPLCTILYLAFFGDYLRPIFFLTIIPAAIAVILLMYCVREKPIDRVVQEQKTYRLNVELGRNYYFFLFVSMIFYLGSGVETFFILKSHSLGFALTTTVFLYMIYNVVYALCSYPIGIIADIVGPSALLPAGFLLFALVSILFGIDQGHILITVLFALYGLYMASTKGVMQAHISHIVPQTNLGFAFGLHNTLTGICMFIGSYGAGILWTYLGDRIPFFVGGGLAIFAALLLFIDNILAKMRTIQ